MPSFDIPIQSRTRDNFRNKEVANYSGAVPESLSTINTSTDIFTLESGFPSQPSGPNSSSSNQHLNFDLAVVNRPNISTHASYSGSGEWLHPSPQDGTPSQANELLIGKLRGWLWLFLKARCKLRRRYHLRRRSASNSSSWTRNSNNTRSSGPSQYFPISSSGIDTRDLATGHEASLFNVLELADQAWLNNSLGIFEGDPNALFLEQPDTLQIASEEGLPLFTGQKPVVCLDDTALSDSATTHSYLEALLPDQARKRSVDCMNLDESPVSQAAENPREKKKRKKAPASPLFACPFYKHDPARYITSKTCCGPGWDSVHRVKGHIFRKHKVHEHRCRRCCTVFDTDALLTEHQRTSVSCELETRSLQEEEVESIDASQEKLLRKRVKNSSPGPDHIKIEKERWADMYRIIFPHDGPDFSSEFEKKVIAGFDQRIRIKLDRMRAQEMFPAAIAEVASSALRETVQSCQQINEEDENQHSPLMNSQPQESQSYPRVGSQLTSANNKPVGNLDDQLLIHALLDADIGPISFDF
ncbi:hypothetical protein F66182_1362 [Fusarium sp. NRRL 66182]|nr:hypothetical protein F66182_1362 [Fusarium sp. NRRL 66182]